MGGGEGGGAGDNYSGLENKDLESLLHWLSANKITLHITETEVVIYRTKGNVFDTNLKLKMCGKKFYPSHHVKYLGLYFRRIFKLGNLY